MIMQKIKINQAVCCACLFLLLPAISQAQTAASTPVVASSTSLSITQIQSVYVPPIISQIKEAKARLADVRLNYNLVPVYKTSKQKNGKSKKVLSKYNLNERDVALAVYNPILQQVQITLGIQNGKNFSFNDPNFDIQTLRFNGVNSRFQVNRPQNGYVVALKYLITPLESGNKSAIESKLSPVVYVPYSQALSDPQVIQYGADYLDKIIQRATADLQNLPSSAIPGQNLVHAIPPAMIKALVYAEHTDTGTILGGGAQDALNQLNILFATNEGDAYKYSVSNDGFASRGIAQFVPSTYQSLVKRHPEAALMPDFVAGMEDHLNSIKAMYLLLDDYAGAVRVKASNGFVSSRVFDYGAASYNAGTARVANAVNQYGDNWNADRSGQIDGLKNEIAGLKGQIKSLKNKIKSTKDKKNKQTLQGQLTSAQNQASADNTSLTALQAASLKNATVNYLKKIYAVIPFINGNSPM